MLEVQKYLHETTRYYSLKTFSCIMDILEYALINLKEEYGIKYNIWENKLVVLNYDQIDSAKYKFDPIVRECRSLVLELGTWKVVSRSFDRFFNIGEDPNDKGAIEDLVAYEKVDGSLISVFYYDNQWLYRTKSVIMPEGVINESVNGVTWKDAIEEAMGDFIDRYGSYDKTYIFELVCKENRVVVDYKYDKPVLYFLAERDNSNGCYRSGTRKSVLVKPDISILLPKQYKFDTLDHCLQSAKDLPNLEEGYVMYNKHGEPVVKVKNPAYVAAHHLRGNGPLTERRVLDIILMGEVEEYLGIFPEDYKGFEPYIDAYSRLQADLVGFKEKMKNKFFEGWTQKEFALFVKDEPYASVAFKLRQGKTMKDAWSSLTKNSMYCMILKYKGMWNE